MNPLPIFASVVCVVRNQGKQLDALIKNASACPSSRVRDDEFIIIDNVSTDQSIGVFEQLTGKDGFPNL